MTPEDKELCNRLYTAGADGDAMYCWNRCTEAATAIKRLSAEVEAERNSALTRAKQVAELGEELAALRAQIAEAQPVARLLHWRGPTHYKRPHGGVAARTFEEYSKEDADAPDSYWKNGEPLYLHPAADAKDAALENCRLLAARNRKEEWSQHILRFCESAGTTGSPLRDAAIKGGA